MPGHPTAADDHGHGTHVAGTIAQATHNGVGAAGIAPNATILPYKVLSASGGGQSTWIAAAIDDAVDNGAQVINLSLGGGHSDIVVLAVEKARRAGVVVVAAAGNAGREGIGSPADAPAALAVTAVGPDDRIAPYSSWGKGVEIAAAAAVLFGAGAESADEVERYLKEGAVDADDPLRCGAGRLDVAASVRRLLLSRQGLTFAVGGLLSLGLAGLGSLPGRPRAAAVLAGAVVAGGAFVLPLLPIPRAPGFNSSRGRSSCGRAPSGRAFRSGSRVCCRSGCHFRSKSVDRTVGARLLRGRGESPPVRRRHP